MSEQVHGFKRINFFKGFLTTEKDWNDAERYHIDKRRLHNRLLHSPGIVHGYAGELKVTARARGDLSVEVQPGYAIDGQGNDLMIFDAAIRNINLEEFRLPQTVYIVLRYYEELTDFIAYKENLEYKGHRRVLESCRVELSQTEPDINREVKLARIYLEKGVQRIRDARGDRAIGDPHHHGRDAARPSRLARVRSLDDDLQESIAEERRRRDAVGVAEGRIEIHPDPAVRPWRAHRWDEAVDRVLPAERAVRRDAHDFSVRLGDVNDGAVRRIADQPTTAEL